MVIPSEEMALLYNKRFSLIQILLVLITSDEFYVIKRTALNGNPRRMKRMVLRQIMLRLPSIQEPGL